MPAARGAVGVNVAVAPEQVTVPPRVPIGAGAVTVKVVAVRVEQFKAAPALSGSSVGSCRKVALITWLNATPVGPGVEVIGVVESTEGPATASKFQE
jgi:hypothetical protein